ncbi:MAG TPA: NAD(+) kinase [Lachnospiraceae bacterium]|nr:NAD(+) kinase [Lachnospiraceae bacterium]
MQHFYLITNESKDKDLKTTAKLEKMLKENGGKVTTLLRKSGKEGLTDLSVPEDTDCIIVLGGDGTLLKASVDTMDLDIPLLGINLGTMGFMAEVERGEISEAVKALSEGRYSIEERMMLDGELCTDDGEKKEFHALNDIVLTRTGSLKIVSFDIYVNGQLLSTYSADGVIISTPTGSTGYNMSAGGPIVSPRAKLLLLTPICPHAITAKSIVLSDSDEISVEVGLGHNGERQEVECNFDGSPSLRLFTGDRVRIKRSERVTKFVRLKDEGFLKLLHKKLQ